MKSQVSKHRMGNYLIYVKESKKNNNCDTLLIKGTDYFLTNIWINDKLQIPNLKVPTSGFWQSCLGLYNNNWTSWAIR